MYGSQENSARKKASLPACLEVRVCQGRQTQKRICEDLRKTKCRCLLWISVKSLIFSQIFQGGKFVLGSAGHLPLSGYWGIHVPGRLSNYGSKRKGRSHCVHSKDNLSQPECSLSNWITYVSSMRVFGKGKVLFLPSSSVLRTL